MVCRRLQELIIKSRLSELRQVEDKSEQQANIIKSGQVDLWLQEHKKEFDELTKEVEYKRELTKYNNKILRDIEKDKLDGLIANKCDILESEAARLKIQIVQTLEISFKLAIYNQKMKDILYADQSSLENLSKNEISDISLFIDLDVECNSKRYWKLFDKKVSLKNQVMTIDSTMKL